MDAKVDLLLLGQDRTNKEVKDLSERLNKVEAELVSLKAEKTTTEKHRSGVWAMVTAAASLVVSAISALAERIIP